MRGGRPRKVLEALALGLIGSAAVLVVLLLVNAEGGFTGCTGTSHNGWIMPLVAVSALSGLTWILLRQESTDDEDRPADADVRLCPKCGHDVLSHWRMCPYCGGRLDGGPSVEGEE